MIGLGALAQAAFGSNTVVRGLPVTPNSPAALNVLVGIGEIYTFAEIDATPWGSLAADANMVVQQGLNASVQTISTPAPVTGGYSICYLIEAQFQQQDTTPAVLPFYNSANPQQPLNGQGGSGAAQATERQGVCVIQAKAGIAAPTGTQVAPTVDSGWTALAVVTVAYGATTVVAGNITVPAGVPQVTSILQMMQTESTNYAVDTSGTANQINIALTPPITAYTDGMQLNFRAANNSSGAVTINAGPGSIQLSGAAGALQSGEIVAGGYYTAVYQSNTGTAVLVGQGAGAEQVNPATQSKHAVQLGQVAGVVGQTRNLVMSVTAASASATLTADEIVVETALGGLRYCLPSFSKTINLATTGAGGMDTGTAPVSGFVALYAIWNPTTSTAALLATNATSAVAPNVYGGANMPSGYTASALVSVWATNSSSQFTPGYQADRYVCTVPTGVLTTATQQSTPVALSIAAMVPKNAKAVTGTAVIGSSSAGVDIFTIQGSASPTNIGQVVISNGSAGAALTIQSQFVRIPLITAQTVYYLATVSVGTMNLTVNVTGYDF